MKAPGRLIVKQSGCDGEWSHAVQIGEGGFPSGIAVRQMGLTLGGGGGAKHLILQQNSLMSTKHPIKRSFSVEANLKV